MTSEMIVRDCCISAGCVAVLVLILAAAGVVYSSLQLLSGICIGLYLFGLWVSLRYE